MHNIVLLPAQKWGQPGRSAAILQYLPFRRETNESSGPNAPFGAKLISVFHDNFAKGIQSHRGLVLLFDRESGAPVRAVYWAATQIEPAPSPSAIKPNWESP